MKKIKIMDYEQKYKDALERASNLHKDAVEMENNMTTKTCEIIFPELKESKDERIKFLIKGCVYASDITPEGREEIFAWLEKQGEQHPHVDVNKMVDKFAHTEVKGHGVPSMIEVDAYRRGIEDALKYCLTYMI